MIMSPSDTTRGCSDTSELPSLCQQRHCKCIDLCAHQYLLIHKIKGQVLYSIYFIEYEWKRAKKIAIQYLVIFMNLFLNK